MVDLDAALRTKIDEALRSHADESVASVYRRYGMNQRGVTLGTFRNYATDVRSRCELSRDAAPSQDDSPSEGEMIAKLRRRVYAEALDDLDAGDTKLYEKMKLLAQIQNHDRIELLRDAEKRAGEKHDAWRKEQLKRVRATLDAGSKSKDSYTRDDVYDMIDKALRGNL